MLCHTVPEVAHTTYTDAPCFTLLLLLLTGEQSRLTPSAGWSVYTEAQTTACHTQTLLKQVTSFVLI